MLRGAAHASVERRTEATVTTDLFDFEITSFSEHSLELSGDDVLVDVAAVRVFVLTRGRNAWHRTWARHYQGPSSMHSSAPPAKRAAERFRERGSVFYVHETPALRFKGTRIDLVAVDFHPENSFSTYQGTLASAGHRRLRPGQSMLKVARTLEPDSGHWADPWRSAFSVRLGQVLPSQPLAALASRPFDNWESYAVGAQYFLNWRTRVSHRTGSGSRSVVRSWNGAIRQRPDYGSQLRELRRRERRLGTRPGDEGLASEVLAQRATLASMSVRPETPIVH